MPTHAPSRRHVEAFAEGLARREGRCALRWNGAAWTYGALAAGARSGAKWLRARGLGPGDRVACLAGPCPDVVVWMLACYELGAVWVPINTRYKSAEVQHILEEPVDYENRAQAQGLLCFTETARRGQAFTVAGTPRVALDLEVRLGRSSLL